MINDSLYQKIEQWFEEYPEKDFFTINKVTKFLIANNISSKDVFISELKTHGYECYANELEDDCLFLFKKKVSKEIYISDCAQINDSIILKIKYENRFNLLGKAGITSILCMAFSMIWVILFMELIQGKMICYGTVCVLLLIYYGLYIKIQSQINKQKIKLGLVSSNTLQTNK